MSVCPMEYRYGSPSMRRVFSREAMLRRMILVEAALMKGLGAAGLAPKKCWEEIVRCGSTIKPGEIDRLEAETGHDVAALTILLARRCGECGGYVHLGATSNDLIDTAWSLAIKDASSIVVERLARLLERLRDMALRYGDLLMVGRTHGQHALPITLGFKMAVYAYEFSRSLERICGAVGRAAKGKLSGAVGTMAAWGDKGLVVEENAMRMLGLQPHPISTQVAPRDGFAELLSSLAILASQLDRRALEIRELSRPEIGELAEKPVGTMGSSTMPHKSNPVRCERVSSLAKFIRGLVIPALENIPLWHERDLSNSAGERIMIPHAFIALDEMLTLMIRVLEELIIDPEAMRRNMDLSRGAVLSEALVVRLVGKGVPRHEAYKHVQRLVKASSTSNKSLLEEALRDKLVSSLMSAEELREALRPENYLGETRRLIRRALSHVDETLDKCRLIAWLKPSLS